MVSSIRNFFSNHLNPHNIKTITVKPRSNLDRFNRLAVNLNIIILSFLSEKNRANIRCTSQFFDRHVVQYENNWSTAFHLDTFISRNHKALSEILSKVNSSALERVKAKVLEAIDTISTRVEVLDLRMQIASIEDIGSIHHTLSSDISLEVIQKAEKAANNTGLLVKPFQRLKKLTILNAPLLDPKSKGKIYQDSWIPRINRTLFPLLNTIDIQTYRFIDVKTLLSPTLNLSYLDAHLRFDAHDNDDPVVEFFKTSKNTYSEQTSINISTYDSTHVAYLPCRKIKFDPNVSDTTYLFANTSKLEAFSITRHIPEGDKQLRDLTNLTSLRLHSISHYTDSSLCSQIAALTQLQRLSLYFDESIADMINPQEIPRMVNIAGAFPRSISYLNLCLENIIVDDVLVQSLSNLPTLRTLILENGKIASLPLFVKLHSNSSIQELELKYFVTPLNKPCFSQIDYKNFTNFINEIFSKIHFKANIKIIESSNTDKSLLNNGNWKKYRKFCLKYPRINLHIIHPMVSIFGRSTIVDRDLSWYLE